MVKLIFLKCSSRHPDIFVDQHQVSILLNSKAKLPVQLNLVEEGRGEIFEVPDKL